MPLFFKIRPVCDTYFYESCFERDLFCCVFLNFVSVFLEKLNIPIYFVIVPEKYLNLKTLRMLQVAHEATHI